MTNFMEFMICFAAPIDPLNYSLNFCIRAAKVAVRVSRFCSRAVMMLLAKFHRSILSHKSSNVVSIKGDRFAQIMFYYSLLLVLLCLSFTPKMIMFYKYQIVRISFRQINVRDVFIIPYYYGIFCYSTLFGIRQNICFQMKQMPNITKSKKESDLLQNTTNK